jgi:hypothetical protein
MAGNGNEGAGGHQLMIANGSNVLYVYDIVSHALTQITAVTGHRVAFLDGYFLSLDTITATVYFSALEDGTSWDPLDFFARSDAADKWKHMIVREKELLLFGHATTSAYYVSDDPANPFVPNQNVLINRGILADNSLAMLQGAPIWVADDKTVRYLQGYTPVRVSTHAIEYALSQAGDPEEIDAFTYNEQGHSFYVLNLPADSTGNTTWVYDLMTGLWHQRGDYNVSTGNIDVSPVCCGTTITTSAGLVAPVNIVGARSLASGAANTYLMSQTYATQIDGTTGLYRLRRAPQLVSELHRIIYDRFQLFMEVGIAPASGPGSAPTMTLQYSNDGGQTFNTGVAVSTGLHNAFNTRVIWRKLGQGRQRVFQISTSDPIPCRLVDAFIDYRPGAS